LQYAQARVDGSNCLQVAPSLNNPHHSQFFHSIVFLGGLSCGLNKVWNTRPQTELGRLGRAAALIAGGAYISHLMADAITPRSLPLVGKL